VSEQRAFAVIRETHPSETRPRWLIEAPGGRVFEVEYDRLRPLWRVSPGEYVRRELPDALSQATGAPRDAPWIAALVADLRRSRD
jgi:hypothetical protein